MPDELIAYNAVACVQTLRGGRVKLQTIMVPETEYTHKEKVSSTSPSCDGLLATAPMQFRW